MSIMVTGSRGFGSQEQVRTWFEAITWALGPSLLICGGARGVDLWAEQVCRELGWEIMLFTPEWDKLGKRAGFVRNQKMVEEVAKRGGTVLAFWDGESRGTQHAIDYAEKLGIGARVILRRNRMTRASFGQTGDPMGLFG